ncbi:MAG: DNA topoisomerase I [Archaeoglobaceae archaeon]|nr:DNA topoisomerase I [Archaeoglobaceae archaeon]MDW8014045.1 DNA topoisomerase I [Archaeoglobaceae archaeon]
MSWLIVAEKDLAAKRLAEILFKDLKVLRDGKAKFYYSQSKKAYVIGLKGHILELDFPDEFRDWRNTPLEKLVKADFVKKVKEIEIYNTLKKLALEAERVTIATDYDREGELIGLEALEIVKKFNKNVKIDRVKFSAITRDEILKVFSNPTEINYKLAEAAVARQKIDLLWGAVLTRLLSLSAESKEVLSAGRVQTPTLRLIVERENEIKNFKPEKYYEVAVFFENFSAKQNFKSKDEAENAIIKIEEFGTVKKFEKRIFEEDRPIPFNTTEFLSEAAKFMLPDKAMEIAESLYIQGYISYPRTDNTVYPESLDLISIVRSFAKSEFSREAEIVLSQEKIVPSRGKKETKDHPPIYPTSVASRRELDKDEWLIYELVVRRFLATLAPKAVWEVRRAEIDCGISFSVSGKKIVERGWREIYKKEDQEDLPELYVGQKLKVLKKELKEKETKPPPRYSASSIVKLMEKLNLGTKSTRHEIIKKLISRKYIKGNPFRPTEIAFSVVEVLKKFAEKITLPDMTAELEKEMDDIEKGLKSEKEVVERSRTMLESVLKSVEVKDLKELKIGAFKSKVLGKCMCGKDLVLKYSKSGKRFLGCINYPECSYSIPLPQIGKLTVTSNECKEHGFKILKVGGKKICPYCNYLKWREKYVRKS